jgi:hypothetical protein
MNNLPFGNHNHSFDAEAQFPGTKIKMEVLKTKEKSKDPDTLCESEHTVSIGISPPPTKDSPIIPFESSIVIVFTALDSSGGGYIGEILDPMAIGGGIKVLFTDPVKYANTIQAGKEGAMDNIMSDDTSGAKKTESLFYLTLTDGAKGFSRGAAAIVTGWFSAEEVYHGDNYFGTELHYENAIAHKIRIKITNKFEGVIRTVYDSELAGSSTISPEGYLMPAISYFAVDSPGLWTVMVDSIGSGSCANPKLALRETFTVATPENWGDESKDEPEGSETEEPETFVETISGGSSTKTNVGLETIIGGMVVGGALIYALLG